MNISGSILFLLLALPQVLLAVDPPDRGIPSRGRSASGINQALGIGNKFFSPALVSNLRARLSGEKGANLLPGTRADGLPAAGSPKMLVLLIEFDEYPARPGDTTEVMTARIFGSAGKFPFESLSAYYRRSSYGKLNIAGDVLGWYKAGKRADVLETNAGREALIKKALQSYKGQDFSQYDNNGDGVIDYFTVIWTGPTGEWATFWWGMAPHFSDKNFKVNGKKLGAYSWQGVVAKWEDPEANFKIRTLVHETGHALGLPDYYDYKPGTGPDGGLGHFDMMDSTWYDHNCFSKFMLGWTEPKIITSGGEFKLPPASESGECLMLVPPGRDKNPFGEFFLVENRRNAGNDTDTGFKGGLIVWHVDARLNQAGTNFLYDNQETEHKLLKALEADGLEELEKGLSKSFDYPDFYLKDRALGPDTLPSSRLYDGRDTGISLLSRGGDQDVEFSIGFKK
ncbi:MAG: M6 family metalloprotease domain-containing protein [Elusimicrobiota bacterium]|nr:M6 family metalloprotease domain-containing protein [Elusimicrobiota bacterium]